MSETGTIPSKAAGIDPITREIIRNALSSAADQMSMALYRTAYSTIVRDCLERLKFPEFAAVETTEGMAATIVDTIDLFENAGCTPDKLASVRRLGAHAKPFEKLWRAVAESVRARGFSVEILQFHFRKVPDPKRIFGQGEDRFSGEIENHYRS